MLQSIIIIIIMMFWFQIQSEGALVPVLKVRVGSIFFFFSFS